MPSLSLGWSSWNVFGDISKKGVGEDVMLAMADAMV
eukprot:gene8738-21147_t